MVHELGINQGLFGASKQPIRTELMLKKFLSCFRISHFSCSFHPKYFLAKSIMLLFSESAMPLLLFISGVLYCDWYFKKLKTDVHGDSIVSAKQQLVKCLPFCYFFSIVQIKRTFESIKPNVFLKVAFVNSKTSVKIKEKQKTFFAEILSLFVSLFKRMLSVRHQQNCLIKEIFSQKLFAFYFLL